jgi:hypothetical protein
MPYLFSGHDVERWLLKTLKAMAVSPNLARGRERLPGTFHRDISVIEMLDDHRAWQPSAGLYFVMTTGARFVNTPRFRLQPWFDNAQQEIIGLWASFVGLEFVMMIAAPTIAPSGTGYIVRRGSKSRSAVLAARSNSVGKIVYRIVRYSSLLRNQSQPSFKCSQ